MSIAPRPAVFKPMIPLLLFVGVLVSLAVSVVAAPSAYAAGGLCYDGLAGVTTKCPVTTSFAIDGKKTTAQNPFDPAKCYRIDDPEKGWTSVNVNCGDQVFKDVVNTVKVPEVGDKARSGNCPVELDPSGKCDIVALYLNPVINGLAIVVVLGVVISIIIGGIQYSASADQPQAAAAAKGRIINAVIALIAFIFFYTFLQWIVPGGLL
jgi:hypothetical protein